jgi:hypothetical protein
LASSLPFLPLGPFKIEKQRCGMRKADTAVKIILKVLLEFIFIFLVLVYVLL